VLRALHPCGEGINIVPKIPDGALTDSVILERRDEFDVKFPTGLAGFDTAETWNVQIVQLPVLKTPIIAIAYVDNTTRDNLYAAWNDALKNFGDLSLSTTTGHDATYYYPSWHSESSGVAVTILNMANLDADKAAISMTKEFITIRRTYEGTTMDFDANQLTNKGRLISGQIASDLSKETLDIPATEPVGTLKGTQTAYLYADIPLSETELTQQDSKVRQAEAIEGDYSPCRFWEPVFTNSTAKDVAAFDNVDPNGEDRFITDALRNINIPLLGWGIKINFWLSIHKTSSIRIKRREGLEMNTSAMSDYSPFSTPAFPRDDRAQMVFREFCREQDHSFAACYNSLGGMLKDIIGTIGGVLSQLNIPIVSDIARTATPILTTIADVLPI